MQIVQPAHRLFYAWVNDWNKFAADVMQVSLDPQQQEILYAVQTQSRVAVASGTARGRITLRRWRLFALCISLRGLMIKMS